MFLTPMQTSGMLRDHEQRLAAIEAKLGVGRYAPRDEQPAPQAADTVEAQPAPTPQSVKRK